MSYEVYLNAAAIRDLDRLTPEAERRVMARIEQLADDPRPHSSVPLAGTLAGLRRLRVGDFRVAYQVDDDGRAVTVTRIGNRRSIYDRARRGWSIRSSPAARPSPTGPTASCREEPSSA